MSERNEIPDLKRILDDFVISDKVNKTSTKKPYTGDYGQIAEVLQREFGVTRADDPKPILATYGLETCVALAGWSPEHRVAFLTHYDALTELPDSFERLLYQISQQLQGDSSQFDVRIIGGQDNGDGSEKIISFLRSRLDTRSDIGMKLVEEDIGGPVSGKSLALDSRTGETLSYDSTLNPQTREITSIDTRVFEGVRSCANLAYAAEIK